MRRQEGRAAGAGSFNFEAKGAGGGLGLRGERRLERATRKARAFQKRRPEAFF